MKPGLENAEFAKYGVWHRNTLHKYNQNIDRTYIKEKQKNIYFAGQIIGVEGYVRIHFIWLVAGINAVKQ